MKRSVLSKLLLFCLLPAMSYSQLSTDKLDISLLLGGINYQGDLNPNSFTLKHANTAIALTGKYNITNHFAWRLGFLNGKIQSADRDNREYLKIRNLSFYTHLTEINTGLEISLLDIEEKKFTPYIYGGLAVFHFNPWTRDEAGNKIFLEPLSTEGQGLTQYPDRKKYKLTQGAFAFGAGAKLAVSPNVKLGLEFSQRKTFTDYLDDVSSSYVDQQTLLNTRGPKAVELAFRSDEISNATYPGAGEQRGTPTEKDWYYFLGLTLEIKWNSLTDIFGNFHHSSRSWYNTRCPRF